jgi:hypothetical protein
MPSASVQRNGAPPAYDDYLHGEQVFRLNPGLRQLMKTKEHYHLADIAAAPTFGDKLREATVNLAGARTAYEQLWVRLSRENFLGLTEYLNDEACRIREH